MTESGEPRSLRESWDDEAEGWIRWTRTPGHDRFFWRFGLPRFLEMLPPPGRLALDVGCGEGRLTRVLRERGYRGVGFDGSAVLARAAATHPDAEPVAVADAARLPVRSGAADLVVFYMSLQDIDDYAGAIREAARLLGSGGRLCAAIVHPLQSVFDFDDQVVEDAPRPSASAGPGFFYARPYFETARLAEVIERDGIRMRYHSEHRPMEAYARAFEDAGFLIESIREPVPDPDMVRELPHMAPWTKIPWALFVRAIRALWATR